MSIASAIENAQTKIAAAYTACNNKGASMPSSENRDLAHLASTIASIATGGGSSQVGTASAAGTQDVTLAFTGLLGRPIAFAIESGGFDAADGDSLNLNTNRIPISVICDGATVYSISGYKSGSTAKIYLYSTCTFSYSNGTLTITSPGASTVGTFRSGTYKLIYVY